MEPFAGNKIYVPVFGREMRSYDCFTWFSCVDLCLVMIEKNSAEAAFELPPNC